MEMLVILVVLILVMNILGHRRNLVTGVIHIYVYMEKLFMRCKLALLWTGILHHPHIKLITKRDTSQLSWKGHTSMQIVSSGPDSEWQQIKNGYIKMINAAKKQFIYNHLILFQMQVCLKQSKSQHFLG